MKLLDILTSPWLILPEKLGEIQGIYLTHLRGEKIDIDAIEAKLGRPLNNEVKGYEIIDGVAVFSMDGVISKRMNLFTRISGGVSTELLTQDIQSALSDSEVESLLFRIDSPGGGVEGIKELAQMIYKARGQKPMIGHTDGMIASAAYWIGSAMDKLYISGGITQVGSIGVVAKHIDVSELEKKLGQKTTEITAGKFKRIATNYRQLTQEGWDAIKSQVDRIYEAFVGDVIQFRDMDISMPDENSTEKEIKAYEKSLDTFANGRVFIGSEAIDAGLVDGVSTYDGLLNKLAGGDSAGSAFSVQHAAQGLGIDAETLTKDLNNVTNKKEEDSMTLEELKVKHPDLYSAVIAEGKILGIEEGKKETLVLIDTKASTELVEGAELECERIKGISALAAGDHTKLKEEMMFDGKTSTTEAKARLFDADEALKKTKKNTFIEDGKTTLVDHTAVLEAEGTDINPNAPIEEQAKATWDSKPEIRKEFGQYETYLAYVKADDAGQVALLKK